MTPVQARIATAVGIVILVAIFVLPDVFKDTDAPLQPGGQLVYGVSEVSRVARKAYPVRATLHKRPGDVLELQIASEHGERLVKVDRRLQPLDPIEVIEFPLALEEDDVTPGALWLPRADREIGRLSLAGLVRRIVRYKSFLAIEVEGVQEGKLYFEVDTGLLVGFEVKVGRLEVVGSLLTLL